MPTQPNGAMTRMYDIDMGIGIYFCQNVEGKNKIETVGGYYQERTNMMDPIEIRIICHFAHPNFWKEFENAVLLSGGHLIHWEQTQPAKPGSIFV